jgi:hypothetical protein
MTYGHPHHTAGSNCLAEAGWWGAIRLQLLMTYGHPLRVVDSARLAEAGWWGAIRLQFLMTCGHPHHVAGSARLAEAGDWNMYTGEHSHLVEVEELYNRASTFPPPGMAGGDVGRLSSTILAGLRPACI